MNLFRQISIALIAGCVTAGAAESPAVTRQIRTGFLPADWVGAAMRKSLSPTGRFLVLAPKGLVRITDSPERIDAARIALQELIVAPATVRVEIAFDALTKRTVERPAARASSGDREIPFPQNYDPPRISANGPGGFAVVPATPRNFTTRRVGSGDGVATVTSETVTERKRARRFTATIATRNPATITVLNPVPDVAGVRALAEKFGAIEPSAPAWTIAATELLVTPELEGPAVVMNIVPRVVLPPVEKGGQPRRIPLKKASAGVVLTMDSPHGTGTLPGADAEFYRVFLGTKDADPDAVMAVTVSAVVKYLGDPPR